MFFQFFIICKRTNTSNNATHYVKLGKKRRKSSKRNYYITSPRVIIKAIIIIDVFFRHGNDLFLKSGPEPSNFKHLCLVNVSVKYFSKLCFGTSKIHIELKY